MSAGVPSCVSTQTAGVHRPWMKTTRGNRALLRELDGFTRMAPKSKPTETIIRVRGGDNPAGHFLTVWDVCVLVIATY